MQLARKIGFCFGLIICMLCCGIGYGEDLEYFKHNSLLQDSDLRRILNNYPAHPNTHVKTLTNKGTTSIRDCNILPLIMLGIHHFSLPL